MGTEFHDGMMKQCRRRMVLMFAQQGIMPLNCTLKMVTFYIYQNLKNKYFWNEESIRIMGSFPDG